MDLGDTLPFRSDVYNLPAENGGVLTNATSASLTITLPDGTTATPTVTNPSTGKYACDYTVSPTGQSGRYVGQWLFTFFGGATTSYVETFDVGGALVTVDEALTHLRASGVIKTAVDQDYLQWLCMVATNAIELDLGRAIVPRTVVETHDGGTGAIVLYKSPVISVTSVTEGGAALSGSFGYVLKVLADGGGILLRGSQLVPQYFWWGRQNIVVTYRVGYVDPPRIVRKVALNAIQAMWQEAQPPRPLPGDLAGMAVSMGQSQLLSYEQAAYGALGVVGIG